MSKHILIVLTDPVEGMEDEFNEWYTDQHLGDVLKLEGYESAQRFRLVPKDASQTAADDTPPWKYLAVYEVETDDVPATHRGLRSAAGTEAMPGTPAIDSSRTVGWYYEPITDRRVE